MTGNMSMWEEAKLKAIIRGRPGACRRLGISLNSKKLGSGAFGFVLASDHDENRAIKITQLKSEYDVVRSFLRKPVKGVVDYHSAERLTGELEDEDEVFYVIEMERLIKPPSWVGESLIKFGAPGRDDTDFRKSMRWKHSKTPEQRKLHQQIEATWLRLKLRGIDHRDLHSGNVMMTKDGDFRLIDILMREKDYDDK